MPKHLAAVLLCVAAGCGKHKATEPKPAPSPVRDAAAAAPVDAAPAAASQGLDVEGMDRSVAPGDDFFAFANGGWLAHTQIPPDRSAYGSGAILTELTDKRTADLIKQAASAPAGSEARKVGDFYSTFMAEDEIEQKGLAPLQPGLAAIDAIADAHALARALGGTVRADVDAINNTNFTTPNIFGLWVAQDLDDPSRYLPFLLQGGLGLPDRDYYLDASPKMAELRTQYTAHIAAMLKLAGIADPDAKAHRIFDLEHAIAQAHASRADSEDVTKGDNHWRRADFAKRAPGLDWEAFFAGVGLDHAADFVVWHPSAVTGVAALVKSQPLSTWKEYLTFHAIEAHADVLPRAFVDETFAFYGKTLSGTPVLRERWKRAVSATSAAMGQAIGKLYVAKYFPASEKARAEAMVANIIAAFGTRIDGLTWMSPATKEKAKAKLAALKVGVGYPDHWRDYGGLEVVTGDAFGNEERAGLFELHAQLAKLGAPVDRGEWVMDPQLVNAVNLPAMNAMNFPAAILQPPNFDPDRPAAMDYGAIGAVIGHEISHSFDDQGALFDATGKLQNWWTPEDLAHFKASAKQLVAQYDAYRPFPDLAVNGTQTLSENIADVAGLQVAYDAYRLSLGGGQAPVVAGFTGDQQFFISFAQTWRVAMREPALRRLILTNGHAPGQYRAATVRNLDAWYAAFDVKPGQKLYLPEAERVHMW
ncbi:MAG TPA: M13 family metallopeptidase [Kofleriaceae bacterium]|nr:M13 family metallopeptidase [Kofleriaceae bacterium]